MNSNFFYIAFIFLLGLDFSYAQSRPSISEAEAARALDQAIESAQRRQAEREKVPEDVRQRRKERAREARQKALERAQRAVRRGQAQSELDQVRQNQRSQPGRNQNHSDDFFSYSEELERQNQELEKQKQEQELSEREQFLRQFKNSNPQESKIEN